MDAYNDTLQRLIGNSLKREEEAERSMQATIDRIIGSGTQATIDRLTGRKAPQPGNGPGTYRPKARATGKDTVALFIPSTAFKSGDWRGFQRARDRAIDWLKGHRHQVEDGQALCWGPAFDLDPKPLSYRDSTGTLWFNCSISTEQAYYRARVSR